MMHDADHAKLFELIVMGIVALWGGLVSFFIKMRRETIAWSIASLTVELVISGFSGLLVYWLVNEAFSFGMTGILVGIAGNMGSRVIPLIENAALKYLPGSKNKD